MSSLSRVEIGAGGHINRALAFLSEQVARLGWSTEPRRQVRDKFGAFAWTVDLTSPLGQEYRSVLTARAREPPFFWSVTGDLEEIAIKYDAWLFGYFGPPERIRVFDPFRYDHMEDLRSAGRGTTYEFRVNEGVDLGNWLSNPLRRVIARRIG